MQDRADPPSDSAHHDGYRLQIAPAGQTVRATLHGETIAESDNALMMRETRHAPVYYFPRDDVRMQHLVPTTHRTHCPFKGNASYWSIHIGDRTIENVAWSYEAPYDEATAVKDYIAFYWDKLDDWLIDEKPAPKPQRSDTAPANPLVSWIVEQAWRAPSTPELLDALAGALRDADFPLWRARLLIQTLNPLLFATGFTWQIGEVGIAQFQATHAGQNSPQYQDSPFAAIINGEGGIRRRLQGPAAQIDFPVLHELVAEGATDYVAVPMKFSDGQINILVLVSDATDGFTTEQLGHLYEILPNLSRLLEAHAQRASSLTLLKTYLGQSAGHMVMDGLVKRGDAKELPAVIWLTDLRDSTVLAESLSKEDYLAALNDYYDCVAGAVVDHGGDVLKFIGDAVLAIFPFEDTSGLSGPSGDESSAVDKALAAADEALTRIAVINTERVSRDSGPPLKFGTGLHCDTLTFGNVGTPGRLDFTVIGSGVNKTARIAALCKELDTAIVVSEAIAGHTKMPLTSLGRHTLRGFAAPQELFTPQQAIQKT